MVSTLQAVTFVKTMPSGRTNPSLMFCEDNKGNQEEVFVKLKASLELKETSSICELIASLLANDLGLPVPRPFLIQIPQGFEKAIPQPEIARRAADSTGLNFGCRKLPEGSVTWPLDKPIPIALRALASEIFAFDILIQNPDRRRDKPNLLWNDDDLFIFDHEMAFSFLTPIIGWQPPWTGQSLEFSKNHVFYDGLRGHNPEWERMTGALEAITDQQLQKYADSVPQEWRQGNASSRIVAHLKEARENRAKLFSNITQLLQ